MGPRAGPAKGARVYIDIAALYKILINRSQAVDSDVKQPACLPSLLRSEKISNSASTNGKRRRSTKTTQKSEDDKLSRRVRLGACNIENFPKQSSGRVEEAKSSQEWRPRLVREPESLLRKNMLADCRMI